MAAIATMRICNEDRMSIETMNRLDAALEYRGRGYSVIPIHHLVGDRCSCENRTCESQGKHPRVKWEEYQARTATEDEINTWWTRWPRGNIGIVTGAISGLVILDVDGKAGLESLNGRQLPPTPVVRTGGGGWHYWFQYPGGTIRNFARKLPGVDLRGDGGLVVAPPSSHLSGNQYEWLVGLEDAELAPCPKWLLDMVSRPNHTVTMEAPKETYAEGERNDTLFRAGCSMRRRGMSQAAIQAALLVENQERCKPPLTTEEVKQIAESAATYDPEADLVDNPRFKLDPGAAFPDVQSHLTDWGNGQRLVAQHGGDIRYCVANEAWHVWDEIRWLEDDSLSITRLAKRTAAAIYKEAEAATKESEKIRIYTHAVRTEAVGKLAAMCESASSEPGIQIAPSRFDTDPWLLNCMNGMVDLRSGRILPHSREEFCAKLAPVEYDPRAEANRWLTFLERVFDSDRELIAYIQRATGYALTGITNEEVFFLLYGTGRNGKSTFIETIRTMLGDYARQTDFKTFIVKEDSGPREDIASLVGARFVSATEVESGKQLAEVVVKQLTGRDSIRARKLYKNGFEFTPLFKLFLAANHKPIIRETTAAMWERVHLVPFTQTIPAEERDVGLRDKLRVELPGILTWAVEGCRIWQRQGLCPPAIVLSETESYRGEMDILAGFLNDYCDLGPERSVAAGKLYLAYREWCDASGDKYPVSQMHFSLRLQERNAGGDMNLTRRKDSTTRRWVWHGIGLKSEAGQSTTPEPDLFDNE